jgi:Ca-activated chloride channel family protein
MSRCFVASVVIALFAGLLGISRAQEVAPPEPRSRPGPALTAPPLIRSEGAEVPVGLRDAAVRIEVDGSLARTTLDLVLFNPNDRILEGTLEFPLQPGQQIAGFALDVNGAMRDAVPVSKPKAQQVFESIERRNVDPGLLEQTAGNQFRLRVYPIPPRGTRQVRLVVDEAMRREGDAWRLDAPVHLLAGAESFRLALRAQGLRRPPVVVGAFEGLRFERENRAFVARVQRSAFRPATGLSLRFPAGNEAQTFVQTVGDERYVLIELPAPPLPAKAVPAPRPTAIGLLWDASASARQRDLQSELALLERYFSRIRNVAVELRFLRDVGEDGGRFEVRDGDWSALRRALETAVYDGASDLADWMPASGIQTYLLFSDGLQTYGSREFPALASGQTLIALSSAGPRTDAARLTALAEARGGRLVLWQAGDAIDGPAGMLLGSPPRIVGLEGEGIEALQPERWHFGEGPVRLAGRLTRPDAVVRVKMVESGNQHLVEARIAADAPVSSQVAGLWAGWRVAALAGEPERHRGEVARIGQRFGIVTPGTSLLVLEAAADYVRYDIPAPVALADEVALLRRTQAAEKMQSRSQRLEEVAGRFAARLEWWKRDFPKNAPPKPKRDDRGQVAVTGSRVSGDAARVSRRSQAVMEAPAPAMAAPPPPSAPPPPPAPMEAMVADAAAAGGSANAPGEGVSIRLQPWAPDSEYARRLRAANPEDLYALYLDERDSHVDSTAFYLDVADLLLQKGRRGEALRVLSNLAELRLENRHVLRVLGYRLMQAQDHPRAAEIFREVLRLADEEPQSHRDLGLALAAAGDRQAGIEHLYEVAARPWDARFAEVELVALNEMNAILATSPIPLQTGFIDPRLLKNMPLDLRVVLAWDSDNSDMDLWVTDPNGEKCYYGNRNTYQGGLISDDFTGGYGPEEFVLKDAKPGKYKVEANFFGDRQQIVTGATTLTLRLSTGWGTSRQQDQTVTLRLAGRSETVFVGEFEVK